MSQKIEIRCDQCDKDLTYTTNSIDWRLALTNEAKAIKPGIQVVTDMMIYPAIKHNSHFCGLNCLQKWINDL